MLRVLVGLEGGDKRGPTPDKSTGWAKEGIRYARRIT